MDVLKNKHDPKLLIDYFVVSRKKEIWVFSNFPLKVD